MFSVMYSRSIFFMILVISESRDMGLYEVPIPGSLFG